MSSLFATMDPTRNMGLRAGSDVQLEFFGFEASRGRGVLAQGVALDLSGWVGVELRLSDLLPSHLHVITMTDDPTRAGNGRQGEFARAVCPEPRVPTRRSVGTGLCRSTAGEPLEAA